ncbi:MAG TPA: hypothetical protein VHC46_06755, partial [Thermodesulfobacteriota bacterium]|nr:hypothetical protein [Thermodesulfobacteriota bacterium]
FLGLKPLFENGYRLTFRSLLPCIELVSAALITAVIVTLPFIWDKIDSAEYLITGPFDLIRERFNAAYGQYTASSLNAFNFWGVAAMWESDDTRFLGITYRTIGTLIFGAVYALVAGMLVRFTASLRTKDLSDYGYYVFEAITLVLFTLYLFVTRAHERHLLPTIVFFTLITYRTWVFWYIYAVVSCVYVANMVYSYIQLTTDYKGIPDSLSGYFIPGIFSLYLIGYIIVLLSFVINTARHENSFDTTAPRTP